MRRGGRIGQWMAGTALLVMATMSVSATGAWSPVPRTTAAAPKTLDELGYRRWSFRARGPVRGTPVLHDGMLLFGTAAGDIHAVDADTGEERWARDVRAPVVSSPAVADGRLHVASRAAIHAFGLVDGNPVWRHDVGDDLPLPWGHEGWDYRLSSPVVVDGTVYVGTGDGHVHALDAATGDVVWSFDAGSRVRATPTVAGETLYVGGSDGIFHALDVATGQERWRFETDGHTLEAADFGFDRRQIYSAATVAAGAVYFGSRDANLYCLDAATGRLRWKSDDGTSAWVIAAPVVRGDTVFETRSSSGRARALDVADGTERWRVRTGGPIFAAPLLQDGTVLLVNQLGLLLALDATDGEERWRYGLGASVWAPPRVADGRLYVGDDAGVVHAFDGREGPTPLLAVYWDEAMAERAALGREPRHEGVAAWFERRGYLRRDGAGLGAFMERRLEDGRPSIVVFAMDAVDDELLGAAAGGPGLLRRYLEAGGTVVWLGRPPALVEYDDEGTPVGVDRRRPSALLGVDFGPFNGDVYMVRPTAAGRARGLRSWWTGSPQVAPGPGLTALAEDELGHVSAWIRSYGGPENTGFVHLYATTEPERLDEIRAVAEYGTFQSPASRENERR